MTLETLLREVERVKSDHSKTVAELRRVMAQTVEDYLGGQLEAKEAARIFLKLDTQIHDKPEQIEDTLMRLTLIDEPEQGGPGRGELEKILKNLKASLRTS